MDATDGDVQRALWLMMSKFPFDSDECYDHLMGECAFLVPDPASPLQPRPAALDKDFTSCPIRIHQTTRSTAPILSLAPSSLPSFTFDPTSPTRTTIKRDLLWCEPEAFNIRSVRPLAVAQLRHIPAFRIGPDGNLIVDD
jgi:hypothetical protein